MGGKHLIIVRHGLTDGNVQQIIQGSTDFALNDVGRDQAGKAGDRLAVWKPERIYASSLARASETADIIAKKSGLDLSRDVVRMDSLVEIDFGEWEGLSAEFLRNTEGSGFVQWLEDPVRNPRPGERHDELLKRAQVALEEIFSCGCERVVVVSHGGFIMSLLNVAVFMGEYSNFFPVRLNNCSFTGIKVRKNWCELAFLNDFAHLLEDGAYRDLPLLF